MDNINNNEGKEQKPTNSVDQILKADNGWVRNQVEFFKNKTLSHDLSKAMSPRQRQDNIFYEKLVTDDATYKTNSRGYQERPGLHIDTLNHMVMKAGPVSAIILTICNHMLRFAEVAEHDSDEGFKIVLKDRELEIEKGMLHIKIEKGIATDEEIEQYRDLEEDPEKVNMESEDDSDDEKLEESDLVEKLIKLRDDAKEKLEGNEEEEEGEEKEEEMLDDREIRRLAIERLDKECKRKKKELQDFMLSCGKLKKRSWESKKWTLGRFMFATMRDSLVYDMMVAERITDTSGALHHFMPGDASTIRFATDGLRNYKDLPAAKINIDITKPEEEIEYLETQTDALDLDEEKLENGEYKYVQVRRFGQVERAFTDDELAMSIRNMNTCINNFGYGMPELNVLINYVTSLLNAEEFNHKFHQQGFSAKGILHLKASLNRRKLETVRQQWQHLLKGSRNSFQTPIFAGQDDVKWIPLNQNHSDAEFDTWMRLLTKIICAVYRVDPAEVGFPMKDDGGGGGLSGDNTAEKLDNSRQKGLMSYVKFMEDFLNKEIVCRLDKRFRLKFCGLTKEDKKQSLEIKKIKMETTWSMNELRAEEGLPPIDIPAANVPGPASKIQEALAKKIDAEASGESEKLSKEIEQLKEQNEELMSKIQKDGEGEASDRLPEETADKAEDSFIQAAKEGIEEPSEDKVDKSLKLMKSGKKPIQIEYYYDL